MIRYLFILALLHLNLFLFGQRTIEKRIDLSGKDSLWIQFPIATNINIITWNKREIYALGKVKINDNKDNDKYLVSVEDDKTKTKLISSFSDQIDFEDSTSTHIEWEIYLPMSLNLSIETINGDIKLSGNQKGVSVSTVSGEINLNLLPTDQIELTLRSITGLISSDVKITDQLKINSFEFTGKYNGGGGKYALKTVSGNIILSQFKRS